MSIIIKGMDMPVSGARYRVVEDLEGNKFLTSDGYFNGMYYPISSLPANHGKMIDGDALRKKMYHDAFETDSKMQRWDSGCWIRYKMFENNIEEAEILLEAEGDS